MIGKELTGLMDLYDLDAEMLFTTLLLVELDDALEGDIDRTSIIERIRHFFHNHAVKSFPEIIALLRDRKIIKTPKKDVEDVDKFNFLRLSLTSSFRDNYFKYSEYLGDELFEAYPKYGYINDKEVCLTALRTFNSLDELKLFYAKSIKYSLEKHKEILSLIEYAKEQKLSFITMNLESFVKGRSWEAIREFKEGDNSSFEMGMNDYFGFDY